MVLGRLKRLKLLGASVSDALRSSGIGVAVTVADRGALPRSEGGKLSRVDDRRSL